MRNPTRSLFNMKKVKIQKSTKNGKCMTSFLYLIAFQYWTLDTLIKSIWNVSRTLICTTAIQHNILLVIIKPVTRKHGQGWTCHLHTNFIYNFPTKISDNKPDYYWYWCEQVNRKSFCEILIYHIITYQR